jgi:Zn-dependent protease with chaperone function
VDFATVFMLLVPLVTLYVRNTNQAVPPGVAWGNLGFIALSSGAFAVAGIWLLRHVIARFIRRSQQDNKGRTSLKVGRFGTAYGAGLVALFFYQVNYLDWKGSFETLFFSCRWFVISDLLLVLPFLLPFLAFRGEIARLLLTLRGIKTSRLSQMRNQARTMAVLFVPQLLYLNIYRAVLEDVPGTSDLLARHPMFSFLLAGVLLFALFLASPYFIRLLFKRVPLEQFPGGSALLEPIDKLSKRAGISLGATFVWLTGERKVANAAVSGIVGKQRTVFLTDHIMNSLSAPELLAVVAHEIGHARFKHLLFNFLLAIMTGVFVLWTFVFISPWVETGEQTGMAVIMLQGIYILVIFGFFARRFERQADLYAAYAVGSPPLVGNALLKLARLNGVSVKRTTVTHPSIFKRVQLLARLEEKFGQNLEIPVRRTIWFNRLLALVLVSALAVTVFFVEYFVGEGF